ncbi:flagellar motor protein MotB [Oceanospirillum sediminis]|uniref:Flagellar motor protein MotB n=1 Tax=Oceanospirillum sediminis TaxID=2760088 RepID=A0A839IR12_9GAMM|nr:flagellar motor protein MotB [Oceanospirillum sediminis]MBB1486656.1 flagellar motor protein MotB [Oceanospirillum sediminis]
MSEEDEECECPAGIPAWVMTFADLMSLLMCFFVLLLSFSEMDVIKFKRLAGELRNAYGVQKQVRAEDIPMGTSVIMQNYTPGKPEPNPLEIIQQKTTETEPNLRTESVQTVTEKESQTEADAEAIARILKEEIEEGKIQVESRRRNIIIRVEEKGSFSPGSAVLSEQFEQIMDKIRQALAATPGKITIEGHTDDIPINTDRFRSNWDLSSARAASVAYELELDQLVTPDRMKVIGYADTKPLVPNDNRENRSKNRRVEIIVDQGFSEDTGTVSYLNEEKDKAEAEGNEVNVEIEERLFELKPDEVF